MTYGERENAYSKRKEVVQERFTRCSFMRLFTYPFPSVICSTWDSINRTYLHIDWVSSFWIKCASAKEEKCINKETIRWKLSIHSIYQRLFLSTTAAKIAHFNNCEMKRMINIYTILTVDVAVGLQSFLIHRAAFMIRLSFSFIPDMTMIHVPRFFEYGRNCKRDVPGV